MPLYEYMMRMVERRDPSAEAGSVENLHKNESLNHPKKPQKVKPDRKSNIDKKSNQRPRDSIKS